MSGSLVGTVPSEKAEQSPQHIKVLLEFSLRHSFCRFYVLLAFPPPADFPSP